MAYITIPTTQTSVDSSKVRGRLRYSALKTQQVVQKHKTTVNAVKVILFFCRYGLLFFFLDDCGIHNDVNDEVASAPIPDIFMTIVAYVMTSTKTIDVNTKHIATYTKFS